jgi:glyoxylase I family protein
VCSDSSGCRRAFPNYRNEATGYGVVLADMAAGVMIGLHHHEANRGEPADESRTGLDIVTIAVPARSDLNAWAACFDHLGVADSGVIDTSDSVKYSVLTFRDPDNIQLGMLFMET